MRVLIGGLLGGVALFGWGFFIHMATPIGHMGMTPMPNEAAVTSALSGAITEPGLYVLPTDGLRATTQAEMDAAMAKSGENPFALVFYQVKGMQSMNPHLAAQFAIDVALALVMAIVLSSLAAGMSYWARVQVAGMLGFFACLALVIPYWNWYGFPVDFTLAAIIKTVGGALVAGLVVAKICPPCGRCAT
ncbi:MAG: hypothetical protein ACT4PU_05820 [Planctomycetota bacterium]